MWDWIGQVEKLKKQSKPAVLVTVAGVEGSAPREIGAKMVVLEDGTFFGTIGGGNLEFLVIDEAKKLLAQGKSAKVKFPLGAKTGQCCGGIVEILFESLNTGPQLYVFGAGHVGQAIARVLSGSIFTTHVIDEREEWIAQLPPEVIAHMTDPEIFINQTQFNPQRSFCVILTHRHDLDETLLNLLLKKEVHYLGLIGSESKWHRFQQRFLAKGVPQERLNSVKCPIGIGNFGKAPSEIAISFAAELLQLFYSKVDHEVKE
jgi:xanthine dehydrogenase accessory factor